MRTIAHLSDIHFGSVDFGLLDPLRAALESVKPDLVVVSGDLTQRAKMEQFHAAKAFLATLPQPQLVVPGNHDVPLWNPLRRFFRPRTRFGRYVTSVRMPSHADDPQIR